MTADQYKAYKDKIEGELKSANPDSSGYITISASGEPPEILRVMKELHDENMFAKFNEMSGPPETWRVRLRSKKN